MPTDPTESAAQMAAIAAGSGGVARILMALHGGERKPIALLIDFSLGALLGVMAAGGAVYFDPNLRDLGWALLIVTSASGAAGAIGLRILDIVVEALKKRIN